MVWNVPQIDTDDVSLFTQKYGVDHLTAALLLGRDIIDPAQLKYFLSDDLKLLHNPFLFSQMDKAVRRVRAAVAEGEKVLVFGDRDVDGITAIVLLVSVLRQEGLEVFWSLPMGDDPYGLSTTVIDTYAQKDVTLCITVDCGTGNIDEIAHARNKGIDTLVIDHHNPGSILPDALAIINPKCSFEHYPFVNLSAVALVMKFLVAIDIAKSDYYDQTLCFLNLRPGNDSIIIEAVKVSNMIEQARISETVVSGAGEQQLVRVVDFIKDLPILIYQQADQMVLLKKLFGGTVNFALTDISEEIWQEFPALRSKSLLRMLPGSRLSRFSNKAVQEIDAAVHLLLTYLYAKSPFIFENIKQRLDITALGLIADMMPLLNENRIMVCHGLKTLTNTSRRGLRELMARLGLLGRNLSAAEVSWRLTPAINATGRMGKPNVAVELLLEEGNIVELANTVYALNEERKHLGHKAWKAIVPQAIESLHEYENNLVCVFHESIHRGITGLLAGRLSRKLNVPAIVIASLDDYYVGSVRSVRGFHVTDFLAQLASVLEDFGGHDAAGGFHFKKQHYHEFLAMVKEKAPFIGLSEEENLKMDIDLELDAQTVTEELERFQAALEPVGQAFQQIRYMAKNVQIESIQPVGRDASHLRLLISIANRRWPAIFWSAAARSPRDFDLNSNVDCVFTLERNYYGNNSHLQLNILDIRDHEA